MTALDYLKAREWEMGNGQCDSCHGLGEIFLSYYNPEEIGHKPDCKHAAAMRELGGSPLMMGECLPPPEGSSAAFSKARWDEMVRKFNEDFEQSFLKALGL